MSRRRPRAHGAVLVTALFLMLAVLMIGLSAARIAIDAEKSARQDRDRQIALYAAEAALVDAERDIEGGADPASARAAALAGGSPAAFAAGCGRGDAFGLCSRSAPPAWQSADLADQRFSIGYGSFTGAAMPTASGALPARLPRYLIELVPVPGASPGAGSFYRISAIGFGSRESTRVMLQSWYRKPPAQAPPAAPPLPARRISWREVANWPDLHQAATK